MISRFRSIAAAAAICTFAQAGAACADDVWEQFAPGDDTCNTNVELVHGLKQVHELQSSAGLDVDWARVQQRAFRSYEVRVVNSPLRLAEVSMPNRVDCAGNVLTVGTPYENAARDAVSIRWIALNSEDTYIRTTTTAGVSASSIYEIQLLDTTYAIPRVNNTATQQTVLLVQNGRAVAVTGTIYFFDAAGGILGLHNFSILPRGLLVLNTAGVTGLAGQSGSAFVAHDGGYGALSGKAVALEPATGFTFDTPFTPKPY